jgi:hypothetical protein
MSFATSAFFSTSWKWKLSIFSKEAKAFNPDIERNMYKRGNFKVTEIKGSHTVFISQPAKVANVIIAAATGI